jgi:hypothetical protein
VIAMCVRQMWRRVEVKKDDLVSSVALLRQRHWLKRLDTGPFFLLYVVTLVLMISSLRNSHRQQVSSCSLLLSSHET